MYAPIGHLSVVKSADWILSKSVSVVNWAAHSEEGLLSCVVQDTHLSHVGFLMYILFYYIAYIHPLKTKSMVIVVCHVLHKDCLVFSLSFVPRKYLFLTLSYTVSIQLSFI